MTDEPTKLFRLTEAQRSLINDALEIAYEEDMTGDFQGRVSPEDMLKLTGLFADPITKLDDQPVWLNPMFTEADQERIFDTMRDEVSDMSIRDLTHVMLDEASLAEVIGYALDDVEDFVMTIQHLANEGDDYASGEFMRNVTHPGEDNYAEHLDIAKRFKLIDPEETELTELGREFMGFYS